MTFWRIKHIFRVKQLKKSSWLLVYHIGMHCLPMMTRSLLTFALSVIIYQLAHHNIPQDFILHIHIMLVIPVSLSVPCVTYVVYELLFKVISVEKVISQLFKNSLRSVRNSFRIQNHLYVQNYQPCWTTFSLHKSSSKSTVS